MSLNHRRQRSDTFLCVRERERERGECVCERGEIKREMQRGWHFERAGGWVHTEKLLINRVTVAPVHQTRRMLTLPSHPFIHRTVALRGHKIPTNTDLLGSWHTALNPCHIISSLSAARESPTPPKPCFTTNAEFPHCTSSRRHFSTSISTTVDQIYKCERWMRPSAAIRRLSVTGCLAVVQLSINHAPVHISVFHTYVRPSQATCPQGQ